MSEDTLMKVQEIGINIQDVLDPNSKSFRKECQIQNLSFQIPMDFHMYM